MTSRAKMRYPVSSVSLGQHSNPFPIPQRFRRYTCALCEGRDAECLSHGSPPNTVKPTPGVRCNGCSAPRRGEPVPLFFTEQRTQKQAGAVYFSNAGCDFQTGGELLKSSLICSTCAKSILADNSFPCL